MFDFHASSGQSLNVPASKGVRVVFKDISVPEVYKPFFDAVADHPKRAERLAWLIMTMGHKTPAQDTQIAAMQARLAAEDDPFLAQFSHSALQMAIPAWHWRMLRDVSRNRAYARAIAASVTPDHIVLDIGAGSGFLSVLAAKAGAGRVYAIEQSPVLAEIAKETAARNGCADRIEVICADLRTLKLGKTLPEKCNCVLHEVFSEDGFGENLFGLIQYAQAELTEASAIYLPDKLTLRGCLLGAVETAPPVGEVEGVDLSALDELSTTVHNIEAHDPQPAQLSEAQDLISFDLSKPMDQVIEAAITFPALGHEEASAVQQWLRFSFPDGTVFENSTPADSHWGHVVTRISPRAPNGAGAYELTSLFENGWVYYR